MNKFNNTLPPGLFIATVTAVGYLIGGQFGVLAAFIVSATLSFAAYRQSDKMVLMTCGSLEADKKEYPELYKTMRALTSIASPQMRRLFVVKTSAAEERIKRLIKDN